MKRISAIVGLAFLAGACTQQYEPKVDMRGVDAEQYRVDLGQCRYYNAQVDKAAETMEAFGVPALVGAGTYDKARDTLDEKTVVETCLQTRGYTVLR